MTISEFEASAVILAALDGRIERDDPAIERAWAVLAAAARAEAKAAIDLALAEDEP